MLVSAFYRSKAITDKQKLVEMTPESFKRMIISFKNNIKEEIQATKNEKKPK